MARVKCRVPSVFAGEINGVPFRGEPGFLLSDEMDADAAAALAEVPGYELALDGGPEAPAGIRDLGLAEAASALHAMPWLAAAPSAPEAFGPPVPGDANGDGKLSAAEKRAAAKKAAAQQA